MDTREIIIGLKNLSKNPKIFSICNITKYLDDLCRLGLITNAINN